MNRVLEQHRDRESASRAAAGILAGTLQARLDLGGRAAMAVSGGSTPRRCLQLLGAQALDWSRVDVTLTDERWVPPGHADSNEAMVRDALGDGPAARMNFLPLFQPGTAPERACEDLDASIRSLPLPFACVLLGMGEDGHFASLFPDAPGLESALDPAGQRLCQLVDTSASPLRRISLTLAALLQAGEIVLLIFGEAKRAVVEAAQAGERAYPVAALLGQERVPVRVVWAP